MTTQANTVHRFAAPLRLERWLVAPVAFLFAYVFQDQWAREITTSLWGTYYLVPAVWLVAAGVSWRALAHVSPGRPEARPGTDVSMPFVAALVAAFQIALFFGAGVLGGMGHSPYGHTPEWLIRNALFFGAPIIAVEMTRAVLVARFGDRALMPVVAATAGLGALAAFSSQRLTGLGADEATLFFLGRDFLPVFAAGVLAGFLCYLGGPWPALIYRLSIAAFWVFSPILPNVQWIVVGFVGVAAPAIGLWVVEGLTVPEEEEPEGIGLAPAWLITAVLSLAIFFFSFGFFGIKPSFVPSHSMEPTIKSGDVVLTRSVEPEAIEVGDIIRYRIGRTDVLHRVVGINADGTFSTKGDNNNIADPQPVRPEQVQGRYVGRVPWAGWLPIKFNQLIGKVR